MRESKLGIIDASRTLYKTLLEKDQPVPQGSSFCDSQFKATCEKIRSRNKARVIQDITRLIVPSAETLETQGATHLVELRITRNQLILCALSKEGSELEGNTPNYAKVTKAKPK